MRCSLFLEVLWLILGLDFPLALRFYDLIMVASICHMTSKLFCNKKVLYLNNHTLIPLNIMGVAEHKNRHLLDNVHTLLLEACDAPNLAPKVDIERGCHIS